MNEENKTKPLTTLLGGEPVTVTMRDGSQETVNLNVITIRQIPAFADALGDECSLIEMVTGKDPAWVDSLTPGSHADLVEKGRELNDPLLESWMERQMKTTGWAEGKLLPLMQKLSASPLMNFAAGQQSSVGNPSRK